MSGYEDISFDYVFCCHGSEENHYLMLYNEGVIFGYLNSNDYLEDHYHKSLYDKHRVEVRTDYIHKNVCKIVQYAKCNVCGEKVSNSAFMPTLRQLIALGMVSVCN